MSVKRTIRQDHLQQGQQIVDETQAGLTSDTKRHFPLKTVVSTSVDHDEKPDGFQDIVINVYASHEQAAEAVQKLYVHGFDMSKLSIIGKDYHTEEHPVGFYTIGDNIQIFGNIGAFFGGLIGLISGVGLFFVPGIGPIFVAGSFLTTLVGTLEGALVGGGLNAFVGALIGLGIPKNNVIKYDNDLKAGKFILMIHGMSEELAQAKDILLF